MLSRREIMAFYDGFDAKQDRQFYENAAIDALVRHGGFAEARSVYELGCGTGRLAARLLAGELPPEAEYFGIDISETMAGLASERLAPFGERARVGLRLQWQAAVHAGRGRRIRSS